MSIHHPFDAADPFGTRQDEKPPLGWPQGWDDQFWEEVQERIAKEEKKTCGPDRSQLPPPRRRRGGVARAAVLVVVAAGLLGALASRKLHPPRVTPGEAPATIVHVNGSHEPGVAVEWITTGGCRTGYIVLQSIDPEISYVLVGGSGESP